MSTPPDRPSPYHAGEVRIQKSIGVADHMDALGRKIVRDHLIDQHREFYPQLPFVALGAVDAAGEVWATVRAGRPGFMQAPGRDFLSVRLPRDPADPADAGMNDGDALGLIGMQLETRRRNRLNGRVRRVDERGFDILVEHSYGNCPQYIQLRDATFVREPEALSTVAPEWLEGLDDRARDTIRQADTFFVASYVDHPDGRRQVDASHRAGRPGFVRLNADDSLTIPEFAGNLFFNTLGNFLLNPKAGLVFVDFSTGELLQMTGEAEAILDSPEIAAFQAAERLWTFRPRRVVRRSDALAIRWTHDDSGVSPNVLMTGDWDQAEARLKAAALAKAWRPFKVIEIVDENAALRSLRLAPADGAGSAPHAAGQHLPIRIHPATEASPVIRSYTLSSAPSDPAYRISVKKQGLASRHLHDLAVGDIIEARAPAGGFTLDALEARPAVLLGAGVGVTPMIAMLRHIVYEGLRKRRVRPTWFFQSARTPSDLAFQAEIAALVAAGQGAVRWKRVLSEPDGQGDDHEAVGRIDMALLQKTLPFGDYDFYLCGPQPFMQSVYDGLRGLSVADGRIHAEAFGPSGLMRAGDGHVDLPEIASTPVKVAFLASGKEAQWTPEAGSLLDLAEARGLTPEAGCRVGACGACKARIIAGAVAYPAAPTFAVAEGEALICCARPAAGQDQTVLQLDV